MATPVATVHKPAVASSGPAGNARPRTPRPPRPNFRQIHQFPLPVNVHHVPPVIPHNPLSLISVALSYLTFFIMPPRQQEVYSAYFDKATSSIHVTDEKAINALWQMGFFGKGNLSRSEPSWLAREKKRRGLHEGKTSEDVTRARREERRELKLERARMEKLAIEETLKAEAAARESSSTDQTGQTADDAANGTATVAEKYSLKKAKEAKLLEMQEARLAAQNADAEQKAENNAKSVRFSPLVDKKELSSNTPSEAVVQSVDTDNFPNEEHLQLSNEEAFFLAYGLGALQIYDTPTTSKTQSTSPASISTLLQLFCHHSFQPARDHTAALQPDDPFMVSYTVYHHFRSLGWVIRSGVKFGTDYLLYNRGPVFSHAEFAVVVIPSYSHPYWTETEERKNYTAEKQARSWWWLHCVNRVQAQVMKSLCLVYVDIPPPASSIDDIGALFSQYKVREFMIKRWTPNRTRD